MMQSLPPQFRALVLGASGALGAAFVRHLQADPACASVVGLHRKSTPAIDFDDEASIQESLNKAIQILALKF